MGYEYLVISVYMTYHFYLNSRNIETVHYNDGLIFNELVSIRKGNYVTVYWYMHYANNFHDANIT